MPQHYLTTLLSLDPVAAVTTEISAAKLALSKWVSRLNSAGAAVSWRKDGRPQVQKKNVLKIT